MKKVITALVVALGVSASLAPAAQAGFAENFFQQQTLNGN